MLQLERLETRCLLSITIADSIGLNNDFEMGFDTGLTGVDSAPETITVTNNDASPVDIELSFEMQAGQSLENFSFSIDGSTILGVPGSTHTVTLAPSGSSGDNVVIDVIMTPQQADVSLEGFLIINTDVVTVSGEGEPGDLAVSTINLPDMRFGSIFSDADSTIEVTLANSSDAHILENPTIRVYLSEDDVLGDDTLIGEFVGDPIAPTSDSIFSFSIDPGGVNGLFHVIVVVDENGSIIEADEDNNVFVSNIISFTSEGLVVFDGYDDPFDLVMEYGPAPVSSEQAQLLSFVNISDQPLSLRDLVLDGQAFMLEQPGVPRAPINFNPLTENLTPVSLDTPTVVTIEEPVGNAPVEHEWFSFTGQAGQVVEITLESGRFTDELNPSVVLYDPYGAVNFNVIQVGGTFNALLTSDGTYYLDITANGRFNTGQSDLTITPVPFPVTNMDFTQQNNQGQPRGTVSDSVTPSTPARLHTVEAEYGDLLEFDLDILEGRPGAQMSIVVLDPLGQVVTPFLNNLGDGQSFVINAEISGSYLVIMQETTTFPTLPGLVVYDLGVTKTGSVLDLAAGDQVTLPVWFQPDRTGQISGSVTIDSPTGEPITVSLSGDGLGGDLRPRDINFPNNIFQSQIQAGQDLTLELTVANLQTGGAFTEGIPVEFYLSTDDVFDAGTDISLGQGTLDTRQISGQTYSMLINDLQTLTTTVSIPSVQRGLYTIIARVNPDGEGEVNTADNELLLGDLFITSSDIILSEGPDDPLVDGELVDFGLEPLGGISGVRQIIVHNRGNERINLTDWSLVQGNDFRIVPIQDLPVQQRPTIEDGHIVIEGGEQVSLFLTFNPVAFEEGTSILGDTLELTTSQGELLSVPLTGTASGPDMRVRETSEIADDDTLEYGQVSVGTERLLTFDIFNEGSDPLFINSVVLDSGSSSAFEIVSVHSNQVLAPGHAEVDRITVEVLYRPITGGSDDEGTVVITSNNGANNGIYLVSVDGTAVQPILSVTEDIALPNDNVVPIGNLPVSQNSNLVPITITNTGSQVMSFDANSFLLDGQDAGRFELTSLPEEDLQLGASHTIFVRFLSPETVGDFSATLTISDTGTQSSVVQLSAGSRIPQFEVLLSSNLPVDNDTLVLPPALMDQTASRSIIIRNDGEVDLQLDFLGITGAGFTVTNPIGEEGLILTPGQTLPVTVSYTATSELGSGLFSGELVIEGSASRTLTTEITVDVPTTEIAASVLNEGLEFGRVLILESTTRQFRVDNNGTSNLVLDNWQVSDPDFEVLELPEDLSGSLVVAPGQSQLITVRYAPSAVREIDDPDATLSFQTNDDAFESVDINLSASSPGIPFSLVPGVVHQIDTDGDREADISVQLTNASGQLFLANGQGSGANLSALLISADEEAEYDHRGRATAQVRIWSHNNNDEEVPEINRIISDRSLRQISMGQINVTGQITINGSLETLIANNFTAGATVQVSEASTRDAMIKVGTLEQNVTFDLAGGVRLFKAQEYIGGALSAQEIRQVNITGGDLGADIVVEDELRTVRFNRGTLSGTIRADSIFSLVGHDLKDAVISARDEIRTVNIRNNIEDSTVMAGFDIGLDGAVGGGDDELTDGRIRRFNWRGDYANSHVAVGVVPIFSDLFPAFSGPTSSGIGSMNIRGRDVTTNNGGQPFGFYFAEDLRTNLNESGDFQFIQLSEQ